MVYLLFGGWIGFWKWRYAFYLYAAGEPLAVLVAGALWRSLPTDTAALILGSGPTESRQLPATLRYPPVLRVLVTIGAVAAVLFSAIIYAPEYGQASLRLDSKLNGIILAARALGAAASSAIAAKPLAEAL